MRQLPLSGVLTLPVLDNLLSLHEASSEWVEGRYPNSTGPDQFATLTGLRFLVLGMGETVRVLSLDALGNLEVLCWSAGEPTYWSAVGSVTEEA